MADLAVLSIVLLLSALLLWAWRERGRAVQVALAAEAEARRARQIDSAAADAADLLAAALTSMQLARTSLPEGSDPECREWLDDAEGATRAIAGLLESARVYVRGVDGNRAVGAEACVRLAVAIARAEGRGVALRGDHTELPCSGSPRVAIELLSKLLARASKDGDGRAFVTVELAAESIAITQTNDAAVDLGDLRGGAESVGWSVAPAPDGDGRTILIGRIGVDAAASAALALGRATAGATSH